MENVIVEQRVRAIVEVLVNFSKGFYRKIKPFNKVTEKQIKVLKEQLTEYFLYELDENGKLLTSTSSNNDYEVFYGIENALKAANISKEFFPKNYLIEYNADEMVLSYFDVGSNLIYDLVSADFNQPSGKIVQTTIFLNAKGNIVDSLSNYAYEKYHFPEAESAFEN